MNPCVILWFRRDLRLADHPALQAALASGFPVLPLYIHDPEPDHTWRPGAASRWWLHHSLHALDAQLRERGSRLILRSGKPLQVLNDVIAQTGAVAVHWSRQYEPAAVERDTAIKQRLRAAGLTVVSHPGSLLSEPWDLRTGQQEIYRVFSPYWRKLSARIATRQPELAPARLPTPPEISSVDIRSLDLLPRIPWDQEFAVQWRPGEIGAQEQLSIFMDDAARGYAEGRDRPDWRGTSRLSPHLHFGEISPRQIVHSLVGEDVDAHTPTAQWNQHHAYIRELGWRDFAYQLLHNYPHSANAPLYPVWDQFPWNKDDKALSAWQKGQTGIPIIDAGMRQLWRHGWMHNRVRMIVASYLCKNLRLDWRHGARWFWDTLVDADLSSNTLGWQWSAGCGADAAPYFRIFNPISQAEKFDPQGDYVRSFVPELARLSGKAIHQPWTIGGIRGYPQPQCDLKRSRDAALAAFTQFRAANAKTVTSPAD